ncbi:MAG: carbonic anhydrase family protein [Thermodesulfobacteriota bacterium]
MCKDTKKEELPTWSYEGNTGPEHWGELAPEYSLCKTGKRQSPVNLGAAEPKKLPTLHINYAPEKLRLKNTGRSFQVDSNRKSMAYAFDSAYALIGFHAHSPAEHRIGDDEFALEFHMVHSSPGEGLAVIAAFATVGEHNPNLDTILDNLPAAAGEAVTTDILFNPVSLLPKFRGYYTYDGSLTTPPGTEGVLWLLLKKPIEVSAEQVERLTDLFGSTNRPVQPLNDRKVWSST